MWKMQGMLGSVGLFVLSPTVSAVNTEQTVKLILGALLSEFFVVSLSPVDPVTRTI